MEPVTFSPVDAAGIPVVRELAREIWWACYPGIISPAQIEYMLGWMYSEEALSRDLASGVIYEFVECRGMSIGFLAYSPADGDSPAGGWKLHKLYILPAYQGRGLGRAAIEHVTAAVAAAGGSSVVLTVNKNNLRALRAYEQAGFRKAHAVVNDIGGGFVMDDFVMVRALPAPVSV